MTAVASTADTDHPQMSHFRQALLSFYWFATQAHWAAILLITLPRQAFDIGGEPVQGRVLAIVLAIGAFVSMVVAPIFGALSDRIVTPIGRRRPWIILGTVMNVIGIFGLIYFPKPGDLGSLPLFIIAFMWVEFWNNVATAPFSALIPDVVARNQRGSAAGWFGLMTMIGNFVGGGAALVFTRNGQTDITAIYYLIIVIMIIGMLGTVLFVHEPPVTRLPPPFDLRKFLVGLYEPLKDHDFRWVFWTRFLMTMGTFTVQGFLLFFMKDVVKSFNFFNIVTAPTAETAVSFFSIALLAGAVVSSLVAGVLSDKFGRKLMVYLSSALQAIVPIVFVFFAPFWLTVSLGIVFGLGYGAYQAVDWAMASDVLPSEDDYAKDMGVWHVASTFPQVIAVPIAGFLLDSFQPIGQANGAPTLGYTVIFTLATLYFILGTVLVRRIRKVR